VWINIVHHYAFLILFFIHDEKRKIPTKISPLSASNYAKFAFEDGSDEFIGVKIMISTDFA